MKVPLTTQAVRQYVSHWAIMNFARFTNTDSLRMKDKYFAYHGKTCMLLDMLCDNDKPLIISEVIDVMALDTVEDFEKALRDSGVTEINSPPEGYDEPMNPKDIKRTLQELTAQDKIDIIEYLKENKNDESFDDIKDTVMKQYNISIQTFNNIMIQAYI